MPKIPLTTKCDGFLTSEEHIQKLKEAAKDCDKQLIIVSICGYQVTGCYFKTIIQCVSGFYLIS